MRQAAFQGARNIKASRGLPRSFSSKQILFKMNNPKMNAATSPTDTATGGDSNTTKISSELPKLSPKDFAAYNHMAETMNLYHNHFRNTWNQIYAASQPAPADDSKNKLSASRIISMGLSFISALSFHHDIEEQHIFPVLGQRMAAFSQSNPKATGPIEQHREIHAGMDKLQEYLMACKAGEKDFRREEVKEIMDGFGGVLWRHLEEEVRELGAENMRKYWTLKEMKELPM